MQFKSKNSKIGVIIVTSAVLMAIFIGLSLFLGLKSTVSPPSNNSDNIDMGDYVSADIYETEGLYSGSLSYRLSIYYPPNIIDSITMRGISFGRYSGGYCSLSIYINFKTGVNYSGTTISFRSNTSSTYSFTYASDYGYWYAAFGDYEYNTSSTYTNIVIVTLSSLTCTTTLSFDSNGGSSVSAKTVTCNSAIGSLTTPTRSGYTFAGWFVDGQQISSTTYYTFDGPRTAFARWEKNSTSATNYTLSSSVNSTSYGSIIGASSSVPANTYVTLNAVPKTNYQFSYWNINSAYTSTQNPLQFTMTANTTVQAVFEEKNISSFSVSYASGSGTYQIEQKDNDYALITFTPTAGQYIYSVQFDSGLENNIEYYNGSIANCGANVLYATYLANNNDNKNVFKLALHYILGSGTITVQTTNTPLDLKENTGGTSISGIALKSTDGGEAKVVGDGINVTLVAQAYSGYKFSHWEGSKSGIISNMASYQITQEDYDGEVITAIFSLKEDNGTNSQVDSNTDIL